VTWKNILKAPTDNQILDLYREIVMRVGILVSLNGLDAGDKKDPKSIEYRLEGIKENILDDEGINIKHFTRLLEADDSFYNDEHLTRLVMDLQNKLQWRIDNL
jgi:hypothetical protein|tara:strand:+ start:1145 stop:1453 length:309 start_codon:yes stop_codon:yes gene_type:complete